MRLVALLALLASPAAAQMCDPPPLEIVETRIVDTAGGRALEIVLRSRFDVRLRGAAGFVLISDPLGRRLGVAGLPAWPDAPPGGEIVALAPFTPMGQLEDALAVLDLDELTLDPCLTDQLLAEPPQDAAQN